MSKSHSATLRRLIPMLLLASVLVGIPTMVGAAPGSTDATDVVCDEDNGGINLPPGFCAVVVADEVGVARHIAVAPNGDAFVALADAFDGSSTGGILALRDVDGDGTADESARFADEGGNGIFYHDGFIYFAPNHGVERYRVRTGPLGLTGGRTLVTGLPDDGDHVNKTVVVSDDDLMYVNIGSASNACQVENRVPFSPGIFPCPELPVRAGVWLFDATERNQTQDDGLRFATGLRNMVALALQPGTDDLFGAQNGRDQLHDNWPNLYTEAEDLVLPAEELFRIDRNENYGWPYCYYDPFIPAKVLAPEYGGDGTIIGPCDRAEDPLETFPAHWAPLSMLFYTGDQFPAEFQNGAFVAFHGSRFDPLSQPEGPGYEVSFVPFEDGVPVPDAWETFADGFEGDALPTPETAEHRAVGLAQGPDGSLYITDDVGGRIWRVVYTGETG